MDLIRGVAILGILAINISSFAGPMIAMTSPNLPVPAGRTGEAAYALTFLLFEGKMRALFSLLFGAGLVLFSDRADAAGRDGDVLQVRRLFWLMALGAIHYLLLWWGDILFLYAACGLIALTMRQLSDRALLGTALALYYAWHVWGLLAFSAALDAEAAVSLGTATAKQANMHAAWIDPMLAWAEQELHESRLGFAQLVHVKLAERPFWPIQLLSGNFSETLPLMLVGMVLYRRGMFSGGVPRTRLIAIAVACTVGGLALTALFLGWAWPRHFPPVAMHAALTWGMAMPHLLSGCGYAAILVLAAPRIVPTAVGRRLVAAGRMAFSNYILTSVIMTFAFYGWGLGLFGRLGPLEQWSFVAAGWAAMLSWSEPWLRRYRRGPLEWLWRSLIERKALPNRN